MMTEDEQTLLDARIRTLEDEAAIRRLVEDARETMDTGRLADYVQLYELDGVWAAGGKEVVGRDDILRFLMKIMPTPSDVGPRHVVTNTIVALAGDSATATSFWLQMRLADSGPQILMLGAYTDEVQRGGDGWRLRRRSIDIQYASPQTP